MPAGPYPGATSTRKMLINLNKSSREPPRWLRGHPGQEPAAQIHVDILREREFVHTVQVLGTATAAFLIP